MPSLFVLLWSTGFIFAKLGLFYAAPFTFLLLRFIAGVASAGAFSEARKSSTASSSVK